MLLRLANNRISDHEGPLFCQSVSSLTYLQNSRQLLAHEPAVLPDHFTICWCLSIQLVILLRDWLQYLRPIARMFLKGFQGERCCNHHTAKWPAINELWGNQEGQRMGKQLSWLLQGQNHPENRRNSEMAKSKETRQHTWICYQFWEGTRVPFLPWPTLLQVTKVI